MLTTRRRRALRKTRPAHLVIPLPDLDESLSATELVRTIRQSCPDARRMWGLAQVSVVILSGIPRRHISAVPACDPLF